MGFAPSSLRDRLFPVPLFAGCVALLEPNGDPNPLNEGKLIGDNLAMKDDVLPLKTPIIAKDGRILDSIRIPKGQVIHIDC